MASARLPLQRTPRFPRTVSANRAPAFTESPSYPKYQRYKSSLHNGFVQKRRKRKQNKDRKTFSYRKAVFWSHWVSGGRKPPAGKGCPPVGVPGQLQGAPGALRAAQAGFGLVAVARPVAAAVLVHPRVQQLLLALLLPHEQLHHEHLLLVHLMADILGDVRNDPVHKVAHEHDQVLEGESAWGWEGGHGRRPPPPHTLEGLTASALPTASDKPLELRASVCQEIKEAGQQPAGLWKRLLTFLKESEPGK